MRDKLLVSVLALALTAAISGCRKSTEPRLETKSAARSTNPDGTQVKAQTGQGAVRSKIETAVGTVTAYKAGKRIEILTGKDKRNGFELDQKDTRASVDSRVKVGTRVRVVQTNAAGRKNIRVYPAENE